MIKSKLATYINIANNYGGRRLYPVTKISIHHMAGKMTARQCADYFARTERNASSNYTIGWDGSIALSVPEEYRAYTTSSSWCDERAITIEVSNEDNNGGDWKITDKAYNALLDLVTDICRRYNIKDCSYTGDKDGVLQKHEWYAYTNCPGAYLGSKFPEISRIVNQRSRETRSVASQKSNVNKTIDLTNSKGLYQIKNGTNIRLNPSINSDIKRVSKNGEIVSVTEIKNGWAKISKKNEWFWLNLSTQVNQSKKSINQIAREVINGLWGNGSDRKKRLQEAGYNYDLVQQEVNRLVGVRTVKKSYSEIAREVLQGKWGNGQDRKSRLEKAGYNYNEVQKIVNRILK